MRSVAPATEVIEAISSTTVEAVRQVRADVEGICIISTLFSVIVSVTIPCINHLHATDWSLKRPVQTGT